MTWFIIAALGSLLIAIANHTDKYIIQKYLKGGEVGSLIIFSAIFSVVALPFVLWIHPTVFDVSLWTGLALMINGTLIVFAILCYFYALHEDEASNVVPFYQMIPVFGFILGYFILGETIGATQMIAALIIIDGALVLSFEAGGKFKTKVVLYMLTAALLFAVNGVVFKLIAVDDGFWPSLFWGLIGKLVLGLLFLAFVKPYRASFMTMIRENKAAVLGLNAMSEILFILSESLVAFATLLAPIALVLLVNAFQPLFVFIIGVALTLFLPRLSSESIGRRDLIKKITGIALVIIGSCFIGA